MARVDERHSTLPEDAALESLIERFVARATASGATVECVIGETAAASAVASLAERLGTSRMTATREGARFAPKGALVGGSASDVADADLGVSVAHLAIAETGSLLMGANDTEERVVGMLALTHCVVVPAGRTVPSLDAAASALRRLHGSGLRHLSLVTGPSRSADIERVITVGVQGPRALHVVVIEGEIG